MIYYNSRLESYSKQYYNTDVYLWNKRMIDLLRVNLRFFNSEITQDCVVWKLGFRTL